MKQEQKTELTKERILTAAMNEFGMNGYHATKINNICKAGIPKGLLYHNFQNKDEIYLACIKRCMDKLMNYLEHQKVSSDPKQYMTARLDFFQENQNEARLFFEALLQPPEQLRPQIAEVRKEFDTLNRMLYQQVLSSISLRDGVTCEDAMAYFTLMQTMFNGYFSSPACRDMSFRERMLSHEMNLARLFEFMLYGIAKGGNEI